MTEVRKIQCPSCGSNSTFKLFDGNYKCNYCQSNFMVNEGNTRRPAPVNPVTGNPSSAAAPVKVIALATGAFVVMGMVAAGFYLVSAKSSALSEITQQQPLSEQPTLKNSRAFAGSAGSVVWMITENHQSEDSLYDELLAYDPQNHNEKGRLRIGKPFSKGNSLDLTKELGSRFRQYGDLAYAIREEKELMAYDIYTGKTRWNTASLAEAFPDLRPGILKVEERSSENFFEITTTAGDVFAFDPFSQTIMIASEKQKRQKEETITKELYLSDGLKHHLYLFTKKGQGFPIVFGGFVQESRLPGPSAPKTNNVKDIFGNIHIEQLSDKNYFRAQPLLKDGQGNLLILYKSDLSEGASVILERVNAEGKANWTLQDPSFAMIGKAFASENLGCEYTVYENTLIITLSAGEQQYIAIDIQAGKVLWRFNPAAYLQERAS